MQTESIRRFISAHKQFQIISLVSVSTSLKPKEKSALAPIVHFQGRPWEAS